MNALDGEELQSTHNQQGWPSQWHIIDMQSPEATEGINLRE